MKLVNSKLKKKKKVGINIRNNTVIKSELITKIWTVDNLCSVLNNEVVQVLTKLDESFDFIRKKI